MRDGAIAEESECFSFFIGAFGAAGGIRVRRDKNKKEVVQWISVLCGGFFSGAPF